MTPILAIALPGSGSGGSFTLILIAGLLALYGLRLIYRGLDNDTTDGTGHQLASPWWFIVGGILMLLPLAFAIWLKTR